MPTPTTDQAWEAQNGSLPPAEARARGLCWCCTGKGVLYSAFGGRQITITCPERCDSAKARP